MSHENILKEGTTLLLTKNSRLPEGYRLKEIEPFKTLNGGCLHQDCQVAGSIPKNTAFIHNHFIPSSIRTQGISRKGSWSSKEIPMTTQKKESFLKKLFNKLFES